MSGPGDPLDLGVRERGRDRGGSLLIAGREQHLGGLERVRVVVGRLDPESVALQLTTCGAGQPGLGGRVRHLDGDVLGAVAISWTRSGCGSAAWLGWPV